jgi:uncharacterized protein YqhQ
MPRPFALLDLWLRLDPPGITPGATTDAPSTPGEPDGDSGRAPEVQLGGQALVEGVMMRSPRFVGAAVRRESGAIETRIEPFEPIAKRYRILRLPILRGVAGLVEMMLLGSRYLNWSSNLALQDSPSQTKEATEETKTPEQQKIASILAGEEAEAAPATAATTPAEPTEAAQVLAGEAKTEKEASLPLWAFAGTVLLSLALGFCLFVALPNIAADRSLGLVTRNRFALNIAEGCIKATIFIAYLWAIGRTPNIRRLFEFHGAEHKVVYAAENGRPLTPDGARPFDTPHPRCGTGFALLTVIVSVLLFSWLPWTTEHLPRIAMRFVLMPLVAGISYEILKLSTSPQWKALAIVILTPGMWLQRLTTREPDDSQLEVSCAAMNLVLNAEKATPKPN